MKIQGKFLTAMSFGLVASLAAVWPARAQSDVEEQIKALESQVQQLRSQQMEIKKEATEAATKLPGFRYRQGSGLTITAADKAWSWNQSVRLDINMYNNFSGKPNYFDADDVCCDTGNEDLDEFHEASGQVNTGAENYKFVNRRARWYHTFCWDDCFYELSFSLDGERDDSGGAGFRDNEVNIHFDHFSPWAPTLSMGLRTSAGRTHISRSSSSDIYMEHPMIISAFGWGGAGSHAGVNLHWEDVPIGPGEYELHLNWANHTQGTYEQWNTSDRTGIMAFLGGKPFAKTKNKWIRGLDIGVGYQGQSQDRNDNENPEQNRPRLRMDNDRKDRPTLWRTGSGELGGGWSSVWIPGFKWAIGPYFLRYVYTNASAKSEQSGNGGSGVGGTGWVIHNQLNLWSPKGWFTGGPRRAGSIVVGHVFERADVDCGQDCDAMPGDDGDNQTTDIHRNHVTTTGLGMWYYVSRGLGFGGWWNHQISTNTPEEAQISTGCKSNTRSVRAGKGASRSCSWNVFGLGMRYRW